MDYLKQLDDVLEFLNSKAPMFVIRSQIRKKFKGIIDDGHLELILDRLCSEGYTEKGKRDSEWAITHQGLIFIISGGYRLESKQIRKTRLLTTWAVVASLIVGAYYGIRLLDYVYRVFLCGGCMCDCY